MNNVLGIGTDIVYIPRVIGLLKRHHVSGDLRRLKRVTNKFMTTSEQERFFKLLQKNDLIDSNKQLINYTAGVWATKESLLKALSSYVVPEELPPAQTIYSKLFTKTNTDSGIPNVKIESDFLDVCSGHRQFFKKYIEDQIKIDISISHDQDYLVSFAVIKSKNI